MSGKRKASSLPARASKRTGKKVSRLIDEVGRSGVVSSLPAGSPSAGYRAVLVRQKKDLYKDPPIRPPQAEVSKVAPQPLPKRNKKGELVFADAVTFRPNLTPKQVLQAGAFGGTYFRPIESGVTEDKLKDQDKEFPEDWFEGLNRKSQITSPHYSTAVNKYGCKCGGSLGMWESSGWITSIDPYGWFQWYCRFYLGRRSSDDERQIKRWTVGEGPTGRWRVQLMNKVIRAGTTFDDVGISPVIRQTCLHWAYELTEDDLKAYRKKKGI